MIKKILSLLLCLALLAGLAAGCAPKPPEEPADDPAEALSGDAYQLRAAVLCPSGSDDTALIGWLSQSTLLGLAVKPVKAEVGPNLNLRAFDVVYLSPKLLTREIPGLAEVIMEYAENGGAVFVENAFYDYFPLDFFGAASFEKIEGCPAEALSFPEVGQDLGGLQALVEDFAALYPSFYGYEELAAQDYGCAMVTAGAEPLVQWDGQTLYAMNRYGEGRVFFTNPLLPNRYSLGTFDMTAGEGNVTPFSNSTASFNQLLLNGFAEYVAKLKYGYALERVFGYFGSPSMSWELHYEEITGMANDALPRFSRLCEEYLQIPSYALVRNPYTWFLRAESVTYWLNEAEEEGDYRFSMDFYENAYSSGTHVAAGGEWLSLDREEDAGSYFVDYPDQYTCRAVPAVMDYDGDGNADIFCGSKDGRLYFFKGAGFRDGRLETGIAVSVTDIAGVPIEVGSYSAPALVDVDGDEVLDLVVGAGDGTVYWYQGDGSLSFMPKGELIKTDIPGQALPAFCDLNGDEIPDLAVGSDQGILMIYYGAAKEDGALSYTPKNADSLSKQCADEELGHWLCPAFADWDGDGVTDLLLGVYQGYVAVLLRDAEGNFGDASYISVGERNYKGNDYLKFGNFCAPALYDIDGDGKLDLLCGGQEYGMAYPIDSEYFPCAEKLRSQLQYAKNHHYYVGTHFLTSHYASESREIYELAAHRRAMAAYGIDTEGMGANQHSWYVSSLRDTQTLDSIYDAGLLWESGFTPANMRDHPPQVAAENVVALPFFLTKNGQETLLVQNNSVLPYVSDDWYTLTAKYRMPVCVYYHCDFVYESDEEARRNLAFLSDFQWANGYNFNREDQMMLASAAAYHQAVNASGNLLGEAGITINPASGETDFPLYDADVQRSLGVRVALAEGIDPDRFAVEADVWFKEEGAIVVGVNHPVTIRLREGWTEPSHITQVNMAARLGVSDTGASIHFLGSGMMQAVVAGQVTTPSKGWTITEENGNTVFTKFGAEETLQLQFPAVTTAVEESAS